MVVGGSILRPKLVFTGKRFEGSLGISPLILLAIAPRKSHVDDINYEKDSTSENNFRNEGKNPSDLAEK